MEYTSKHQKLRAVEEEAGKLYKEKAYAKAQVKYVELKELCEDRIAAQTHYDSMIFSCLLHQSEYEKAALPAYM